MTQEAVDVSNPLPKISISADVSGEIATLHNAVSKIQAQNISNNNKVVQLIDLIGPLTQSEINTNLKINTVITLPVWSQTIVNISMHYNVNDERTSEKFNKRIELLSKVIEAVLSNAQHKILFQNEIKSAVKDLYIFTSTSVLKFALAQMVKAGVVAHKKYTTTSHIYYLAKYEDNVKDWLAQIWSERNAISYQEKKMERIGRYLETVVMKKLAHLNIKQEEQTFINEIVKEFFTKEGKRHSNNTMDEITWIIAYLSIYFMRNNAPIRKELRQISGYEFKVGGVVYNKIFQLVKKMWMQNNKEKDPQNDATFFKRKFMELAKVRLTKNDDVIIESPLETTIILLLKKENASYVIPAILSAINDHSEVEIEFANLNETITRMINKGSIERDPRDPLSNETILNKIANLTIEIIKELQIATYKDIGGITHNGMPYKQRLPVAMHYLLKRLVTFTKELKRTQEQISTILNVTSVTLRNGLQYADNILEGKEIGKKINEIGELIK